MMAYRSEEDMIQNLQDAGCDEALIGDFMNHFRAGKQGKGIQLLKQHRRSLLDHLHTDQRRIDCLDYLLFMMQKEGKRPGAG